MLSKCCFCVDLRVATLILAVLGTVSHLYNAVISVTIPTYGSDSDSVMTLFSTFSYIGAFASMAGFLGVLQRNPRLVKIFSAYAFAELAVSFFFAILLSFIAFMVRREVCDEILAMPDLELDFDMSTCLQYYDGVAAAIIVAVGIGLFVRLHFAMSIRAYYITLRDSHAQYFPFSYPVVYAVVPGTVVDEDLEEALEVPPAYEETSKHGLCSGEIKI
jgi:flagellar biosynthesis protein FlhB